MENERQYVGTTASIKGRVYIDSVLSLVFFGILVVLTIAVFTVRMLTQNGIVVVLPFAEDLQKHLLLLIVLCAAVITSRQKAHLSLAPEKLTSTSGLHRFADACIAIVAVGFNGALALNSLIYIIRVPSTHHWIGIIPVPLIMAVLPLGFAAMTWYSFYQGHHRTFRKIGLWGIPLALILTFPDFILLMAGITNVPAILFAVSSVISTIFSWLVFAVIPFLIFLSAFGLPIYIVLGSIGLLLFFAANSPVIGIIDDMYMMTADSIMSSQLASLPMFTFMGFLFSESSAGKRLVLFFKNTFGWIPGGTGVMAIVVCVFMTTFTGASGMPILALGMLLFMVLTEQSGYSNSFATGLITASSSVGLLFPPSLPAILLGASLMISIKDLFIAGFFPGMIMIVSLGIYAVIAALVKKVKAQPFSPKEFGMSFLDALPELLLPILIVVTYFSGFFSLIEAAAAGMIYAFVLEVVVRREIKTADFFVVFEKAMVVMGGVLLIVLVAKGLSTYFLLQRIPEYLAIWVSSTITSKWVFLLILNLLLLLAGCFLDIYSAILVLVPLLLPMSDAFGISRLHFGVIFLANMQLGYLTPPVGMNLFLASYRFGHPLLKVYRMVLPSFLILFASVLVITYADFLPFFKF